MEHRILSSSFARADLFPLRHPLDLQLNLSCEQIEGEIGLQMTDLGLSVFDAVASFEGVSGFDSQFGYRPSCLKVFVGFVVPTKQILWWCLRILPHRYGTSARNKYNRARKHLRLQFESYQGRILQPPCLFVVWAYNFCVVH